MNTTAQNKPQSFRSKIFNQAHTIRKATGKAFAICLIKAWQAYRLVKRMRTEVVKFAFEKLDGSLRYATGTLQIAKDAVKGTGSVNHYTIAYFDTVAQGFRSFRIENLIAVY